MCSAALPSTPPHGEKDQETLVTLGAPPRQIASADDVGVWYVHPGTTEHGTWFRYVVISPPVSNHTSPLARLVIQAEPEPWDQL